MSRSSVEIHQAEPAHAEAMARVYNHYITSSTATFHTEPVDAQERLMWLATHDDAHPALVAVEGGAVVGWGALTRWSDRPAWRRTVEVSTYVAPGHVGAGVGSALMRVLLDRARSSGHHAVIAQIVGGNEPSLALARAFGFEQAGVLPEVGDKFGRWLDVVLMQLLLPAEPHSKDG